MCTTFVNEVWTEGEYTVSLVSEVFDYPYSNELVVLIKTIVSHE